MAHRLLLALLLLAVAACKGPTGHAVPVDHPIYEHLPPEIEDDEDLDDEDEDTDDEEDDAEDAAEGAPVEGAQ